MKRSRVPAILCLALVATGHLHSQSGSVETEQVTWQLLSLAGGLADAESAVNAQLERGLVPTGIELEPNGTLILLFTSVIHMEFTGWGITEHTDWNALETDIVDTIRDGFRPVDISRTENGLIVLWLKSNTAIAGWRIHAAPQDRTAHGKTVEGFRDNGFELWGISSHAGLTWYLFIRREVLPAGARIQVHGHDLEALRDGIRRVVQDGAAPRAVAHDEEGFTIAYEE